MQDTPIARQREKLALATVDALRRRGFDAVWVPTAAEMVQRALALLPAGCSVAWGGSQTIRESGLTAAVHAGDYTVIDRDLAATPEERTELHRQGLLADRYLMSANAVAATGELVNIDGTGNRLAALCFGPKEIVMPVSAGKIARHWRLPSFGPGIPPPRPTRCGWTRQLPAPPTASATTVWPPAVCATRS